MKKLIYFLSSTLILSVVVSSCTKVDLPYETFEDMQYGAYARLLSKSGDFDFFNPAGSTINSTVEFYDDNNGQNVANYSWTVEFVDNSPGFGSGDVAPIAFASFDASQFSPAPESGLPSVSFSFGFVDALTALGLDISEVTGGDVIRFEATITKTDGSTFSSGNTGSNIFSSATFAGYFTINATVVCLFPDTDFVGDYALTMTQTGSFGPAFLDQTVEVELGPTSTKRQFDAIYLEQFGIGNDPMTFVFDLVCVRVVPDAKQGSGLACSDGTIFFGPPPLADQAPFNVNDDSVITINAYEFSDGGACGGLEDELITIVLTKL